MFLFPQGLLQVDPHFSVSLSLALSRSLTHTHSLYIAHSLRRGKLLSSGATSDLHTMRILFKEYSEEHVNPPGLEDKPSL